MIRIAFALLLFALLLFAVDARAHALAPALLDIRVRADATALVTWKVPTLSPTGTMIQPQLPAACQELDEPRVSADNASLVQSWRVDCGSADWIGREVSIEGLGPSRVNALVRVTLADGNVATALLDGERPSFTVPARASASRIAAQYAALGVEHLLTGLDHVAFVLALVLLVARLRRLIATVTAFTVGHSLTLSAAVLGFVHTPPALTELLIALSIVAVAGELAARDTEHSGLLSRRPWIVALAFGLLHGFGFAGALAELGLPDGEIPLALFSFNVGIEFGQLAVVAAALVARTLIARAFPHPSEPVRLIPAYTIGSLAALWCLQRLEAVGRLLN